MELKAKARLLEAFVPNLEGKATFQKVKILQDLFRTGLAKANAAGEGTVLGEHAGTQLWYIPVDAKLVRHSIRAFDEQGKCVGLILISNLRQVAQVETAAVQPAFVGKGLGTAMYEAALARFRVLASSLCLSKGSSLAWSKLIQKHSGYLSVDGAKIKIQGFKAVGGIIYPLIALDNGKIKPLEFFLNEGRISEDSVTAAENCYYVVHL